MTFETELRDRLVDVAGRVPVRGPDDDGAVDDVLERFRTGRRRRIALAAGAACLVAALAVLVPVLGGNAPADRGAPATEAPPPAGGPEWTEPVRGSLAGDTAFLEEVLDRRVTDVDGAEAPAATHRVVFAGDGDGVRWALVAGVVDGRPVARWFTGPAGAPAADLEAGGSEGGLRPGRPLGYARTTAEGTVVLVLCQPGDTVLFSTGVEVDADGSFGRTWTADPAVDGTVVHRAPAGTTGTGLRFRVERDGVLVGAGPTAKTFADGPEPFDPSAVLTRPPVRGGGTAPAAAVVTAVHRVLDPTGLPADAVDVATLWTTPLPEHFGRDARAVVVAVTVPSGAVVTSTAYGYATGDGPVARPCGTAVHPAGTALDDLLVAAECEVVTSEGDRRSVLVSAPPGAGSVQLLSASGELLREAALTAGAAVVGDPGEADRAVVAGPGVAPQQVAVSQGPPDEALDVDGG
ncbi:hypothetical protein ACI797_23360 [Geodermatophilus sp. SYSU D00691]